MTANTQNARSRRIEVRTTPEDRSLIDSAVAASSTTLSEFAVSNLTEAARRILGDRVTFALNEDAQQAWEEINGRPARDLESIRALVSRPSPFSAE